MIYGTFTPDEMRHRAARAQVAIAIVLLMGMAEFGVPFAWLARRDDPFDRAAGPGVFLLLVLAGLVVTVWALVRWVMWFHAVHDVAVERHRARFGGSWWAWAWLIPVANVILPYLMVKDLWRAADAPGSERPLRPLLQWWWAPWVVGTVIGYLFRGDPGWFVQAVSGVAWVAGLVLAIPAVRVLTRHAIAIRTDHSAGIDPPSTATVQPVT